MNIVTSANHKNIGKIPKKRFLNSVFDIIQSLTVVLTGRISSYNSRINGTKSSATFKEASSKKERKPVQFREVQSITQNREKGKFC